MHLISLKVTYKDIVQENGTLVDYFLKVLNQE